MIISVSVAVAIILLLLAIYTYYYRLAFARTKPRGSIISVGTDNEEFKRRIKEGIEWFNNKEKEDIYIDSYDGLRLHAYYVRSEQPDGRKIMLMFHGYRSSYKDFACAFEYYSSLGFDMIVVDQRSHGKSEGRLITFGVKERFDVVEWVKYTRSRFTNADIFLDGISMGASTVMMASDLVDGVKGIIADCGYTSPKEIIICVAKTMHVPKIFVYPVGLMARIFGGFNYTYSSRDALSKTNIPIIMVHGLADGFVPSYMTDLNFDSCNSKKTKVLVENAPHGYSFLVDEERVKAELENFISDK